MNKLITPSDIEHPTFHLVTQCLNCVTACARTYVKVLITKHDVQCIIRCLKVTYCYVPNTILSPYSGIEVLSKQRGSFTVACIYFGLQLSE
jgi:hypothetical protein